MAITSLREVSSKYLKSKAGISSSMRRFFSWRVLVNIDWWTHRCSAGALFLLSRSFCASLHWQHQEILRSTPKRTMNYEECKWFKSVVTEMIPAKAHHKQVGSCLLNVVDHNFQQCTHRSNCGLVCRPIVVPKARTALAISYWQTRFFPLL